MEIDKERVDEMVLALLYLTTFKDKPNWRAWKGIARPTAKYQRLVAGSYGHS